MTQFFKFSFPALRASLAIGAVALGAAAPAQAIVYDFKMTGGGSSSLAWASSHLFVEMTENSSTAANDVLFKFTNEIPQLNAAQPPSVNYLYFDTGTYTSLFSGMSVLETSGLVNLVPRSPTSHPYLPANFTPDYKFGLSSTYPLDNSKYGINNGEYAVLSTTLNNGMTFANVIDAMNVGINANAATAASGLRIGVFTIFLGTQGNEALGTQHGDAAHVTNSVVSVPEAETWAMMLAGLGLIGFMARRRTA
jgi:hypothetical protein